MVKNVKKCFRFTLEKRTDDYEVTVRVKSREKRATALHLLKIFGPDARIIVDPVITVLGDSDRFSYLILSPTGIYPFVFLAPVEKSRLTGDLERETVYLRQKKRTVPILSPLLRVKNIDRDLKNYFCIMGLSDYLPALKPARILLGKRVRCFRHERVIGKVGRIRRKYKTCEKCIEKEEIDKLFKSLEGLFV